MSWFSSILNPFKKKDTTQTEMGGPSFPPGIQKDLKDPAAKGMMAAFYRKWKDPAFLKQLRVLASYMAKDGIDVKNMAQVKEWLEKNKDKIESGAFKDPLPEGKQETFVKSGPDVGRNDPCTCGSGKKYKKCCGTKA